MRFRFPWVASAFGLLAVLIPLPAMAQGCLGLPERINRLEVALDVAHQNDGQRIGGRSQVFAGGVFGVALGTRFGSFDQFAESGHELNALVGVPFRWGPLSTCGFGEYEQSKEEVRNNLGLSRGDFMEHWVRMGLAVNSKIGQVGGVSFGLSGGPELIWRVTRLEGRTVYVEDQVFVLESIRRETAPHLGGRVVLALRHPNGFLALGIKNRPRRGPDLLWTVQLGFQL